MDAKTRLATTFDGAYPDRPPILGGWLAAPNHIQRLTGCSHADYWSDPVAWAIAAEGVLGSDGLVTVFTPVAEGEYRCVDQHVMDRRAAFTVESLLAEIEARPDVDEVRDGFDEEVAYAAFVETLHAEQARCGEMLWAPADWSLIPKALWYHEFGYETALTTLALHTERYLKLLHTSAEIGRQHAQLRARAITDDLHPRAILTGEDICSQQGPMVSPAFLRRHYWPLVEYALEPLLAVGAKIVWHCDGNYRPLLDDVLACGVGGLQGFQTECGMDLAWIRDLRTRRDEPLLIFGPLSVTTTLPHGSPADVRAEVHKAMALAREHVSLVFFTSNTITPDIPLENVRTFWQTVRDSRW
jgi:hypothetical protein